MSEDPIKLFSTRAERYPEPTEADVALGAGRAALAAIPFVGGSITEVLSLVLAPAVARRRDTWLKELADGIDQLADKVNGFRIEDLQHNDAFVSAVIEATRSAVSTHQHEKRVLLRNALMNIATGRAPGEDMQHTYLRLIDEFTASHIVILEFLATANAQLSKLYTVLPQNRSFQQILDELSPQFKSEHLLLEQILGDLRSRSLVTLSAMSATFPQQVMTNSGIVFLNFVKAPQDLA